ncbi:ankyrin repeat domain-containing protein [Wolbachia endosymbiont (group B) of Camptogramma bilineatum]|uniref:ankyrin repeat domain-containing protein n=1 Tax=Wolbachia endosymbiont (group B) of Camptogramma bilineatum TaxID=2953991 RepID=UPI002231EA08|nr:ankyrin repeat domain-containing protein [Wolbachia endosymbiont (group B) of Camptogramma bilineatum]
MDKLGQDTKNKLHFWWLITVIVCIIPTYSYMKAKAEGNYKTILRIASQNCNLDVVKFSVENLLSVNTRVPKLTALHHASDSGCLKVTKFLVYQGADISALGENERWTALHFAALEGHLEVVSFLLERGANPNVRDRSGKKPRDVAVIESRQNKDKPYDQIIKLLAEAENR